MIRSLVSLVLAIILIYVGTTIGCGSAGRTTSGWPYGGSEGKLTFVGHIRAIWHSDEVQDLKKGVQDETGPAVKKVEHEIHDHTQ